MARHDHTGAWRRREDRERGQALVEFALVLFPLIVFVGGAIQLGIAVSHWHDQNRIAREGVRWAAINTWPGCAQSATTCTTNPSCDPSSDKTGRTLLNYIRCEAVEAGLPAAVSISICFPEGNTVGSPVTVRLSSRSSFLSLEEETVPRGQGVVKWLGLTVRGEATMRLRQLPTKYAATPGC